jgi:hypothetical protein
LETYAACYVGHRTNYRCAGRNPGGELRDGDAGEDADEQLAGQSLFDPTLVEDGMCTLWFAAVPCLGLYVARVYKRGVRACVPQQDDIGLLHRRDVFSDGDFDGISSEDRTKFLAQAPRAFFALYAGDEAGG